MGEVLYPGYFPNECGPFDGGLRWVESSLSGYMRMIWRVKQWKITVRLENNIFGDGDYVFFYKSTANTEEELVCGAALNLVNDLEWDLQEFNIIPTFPSAEDYRPLVEFNFRATDDGGDNGVIVGNGYNIPVDQKGHIAYQVQISNFGDDVATNVTTIYCCSIFDYYAPGNLTTILEIQANEYWSYGGTYNTSTGEPL